MATKLDRKTLRFLKATAQNVYEPFFKNLLKPYKSSDPIAKGIFEILDDVHRLDQIVDKVIRNGVSIATMSDSITINKLVQKIEVNKDELLNVIANDEATKAHANVGTTPADLKFSQQFATGKQTMPSDKQSKQPSAFQRGPVGGILSAFGLNTGGRIAGAAALGAIARPVLGPYMYPAMAALGGIGLAHGAYKKFRSKRKGKLSGVRPSLQTVGSIEGDTPTGTPDYQIGGSGTYSTTGGGTLVHFFDKDWKKAKWTKDIYDALVDSKTKEKTKRGIGGLIVGAGIASLVAWVAADPDRLKILTEKIENLVSWAKEAWPKIVDGIPDLVDSTKEFISWARSAIIAIGKIKDVLTPKGAASPAGQWLKKHGFKPPISISNVVRHTKNRKATVQDVAEAAVESMILGKRPVESIQESPTEPTILPGYENERPAYFEGVRQLSDDTLIKELTEAMKELNSTVRDGNSQSLENDPFTDPLLPLKTLLGPVK